MGGGELLDKVKLLNQQIEIIFKCVIDAVPHLIIEYWLDMIWFVRALNLFDPNIKLY